MKSNLSDIISKPEGKVFLIIMISALIVLALALIAPGSIKPNIPEEILAIAENSDCTKEGTLTSTYFYNDNSKTWWIDMVVENKPLCNPACVVSVETQTAEINWRCTGLIEP